MESLGEKLRTARNEKGFSFDHVSRETNISIRFLEALEAENFNDFPGEPYITGFLKNYGTFLNVDVQELLSLYRSLKIQEQPVPMEQLLKPHSNLPKILISIVVILIALGAGVAGTYYLLSIRPERPPVTVPVNRAPSEYVMEGSITEHRMYRNDSILVPIENDRYKLELANLGEAVTLRTPGGSVILDLSQEANIDLNNNGVSDLRITVADFVKNNPDMGVLLQFSITDDMAAYVPAGDTVPEFAGTVTNVSVIPAAGTTVIPSSTTPYPFTLQTNFQGYCMFRWEILNERDRRERNERYFQRSDELNIHAQNGIRIWASNAQAAKYQIIGGGRTFPLELGAAGEVVVSELRWVRDDDRRYRLILVRLESGSS
ncbi:MAG: helix-turn-helix domain-containing protein [Treponema sp.]|nr:helix-turn-helix domain-containing protein [Treponema sp.]